MTYSSAYAHEGYPYESGLVAATGRAALPFVSPRTLGDERLL